MNESALLNTLALSTYSFLFPHSPISSTFEICPACRRIKSFDETVFFCFVVAVVAYNSATKLSRAVLVVRIE